MPRQYLVDSRTIADNGIHFGKFGAGGKFAIFPPYTWMRQRSPMIIISMSRMIGKISMVRSFAC